MYVSFSKVLLSLVNFCLRFQKGAVTCLTPPSLGGNRRLFHGFPKPRPFIFPVDTVSTSKDTPKVISFRHRYLLRCLTAEL